MTPNAQTVTDYMDGFRRTDRPAILACLADDVQWEIPGFFKVEGKAAFDAHIEDDAFVGRPEITVTRLIEENDVVVAEGTVRTQRKEGTVMRLAFCDVFELRGGKICRLVSYLVELKDSAPAAS
jgi:ketosteroid isomerase-like protein